MVKYFFFFVLFFGSLDCSAAPSILGSMNLSLLQAGGQNLDDKIKAIAAEVKAYAANFNIPREKVKADKNIISEERKGTSYFVTLMREGIQVLLIYHDYRNTPSPYEAVTDDKRGNKKFIFYLEDGQVGQYDEAKDELFDGVSLYFYKDGALESFVEFKNNRYLGREMEWDESGKLIKSHINDGTREFKFDTSR